MSTTTKNKYKATFILDLRESKDDSAKVMADLNEILKSIGGEPYTQGHYIEIYFEGSSDVPSTLNEKLKLDNRINRIFVESK